MMNRLMSAVRRLFESMANALYGRPGFGGARPLWWLGPLPAD